MAKLLLGKEVTDALNAKLIDRAYRCINWSSLILIVGMIPFATALEKNRRG